jgi:hypothetical protein
MGAGRGLLSAILNLPIDTEAELTLFGTLLLRESELRETSEAELEFELEDKGTDSTGDREGKETTDDLTDNSAAPTMELNICSSVSTEEFEDSSNLCTDLVRGL